MNEICVSSPTDTDLAIARERVEARKKLHTSLVEWHLIAKNAGLDSPFELIDSTVAGFQDAIAEFKLTEKGKDVESFVVIRECIRHPAIDKSYIAITNNGNILVLPDWHEPTGNGSYKGVFPEVELMLKEIREYNTSRHLSQVLKRTVDIKDMKYSFFVKEETVQGLLNECISSIRRDLKFPFQVPEPSKA